jgi:MFS family permease
LSERPSPVAVTALLCAAEIAGMAGFSTFSALQPTLIDTWRLSNTEAGWINGIFFFGYLVSVPVLTSATDRVPPRRVYVACMAASAAANVGFAWLTDGFWAALLLRALAGAGLAGTYMPGLKLLSDYLHGTEHSRSVAFYTSSFGVGSSLSFVIAGELARVLDWRWAFGLSALGPVAALVLIAAFLPGEDPTPERTPDTSLLDFRPVLGCRPAMAYVLAYAAHNFELFALRGWIVTFLVFAQGLDPAGGLLWSATTLAALINLVGVPASIGGNEMARRLGRHRVIAAVMLTSAAFACGLGFAAPLPYALLVALFFVYALTVNGDSAAITAGVVAAAPEGYRGATMAVHSSIGFVGAFLGPLLFGVVLDLAGGGATVLSWGLAFALSGAVIALGPLALRLLGRPRPAAGT